MAADSVPFTSSCHFWPQAPCSFSDCQHTLRSSLSKHPPEGTSWSAGASLHFYLAPVLRRPTSALLSLPPSFFWPAKICSGKKILNRMFHLLSSQFCNQNHFLVWFYCFQLSFRTKPEQSWGLGVQVIHCLNLSSLLFS